MIIPCRKVNLIRLELKIIFKRYSRCLDRSHPLSLPDLDHSFDHEFRSASFDAIVAAAEIFEEKPGAMTAAIKCKTCSAETCAEIIIALLHPGGYNLNVLATGLGNRYVEYVGSLDR